MITQDQLKDVLDRAEKLFHYLKIDQKQIEFEEEDLRTQAPDFWEDPKRAEEQMKKVKAIKKWIDGYNDVRTKADERCHRGTGTYEHAAPEGRPHGLRAQD